MTRMLAEQIIGNSNKPLVIQEVLLKYFRKRALENQPDKFQIDPKN